jgi:hypothetical protein
LRLCCVGKLVLSVLCIQRLPRARGNRMGKL